MQLFCFTYAGGTTAFFNQFESACDGRMEIVALEYAGHGSRMNEKPCTSFRQISQDLYKMIKEHYNGGDYALFGYSMGCFAAIDMYKYIIELDELEKPAYIILAAHSPKTFINFHGMTEDEIDEVTRLRTIEFGEVPEKLLNNKSFWRIYLPIYKNDYRMICDYSLEREEVSLQIPALVFYADNDSATEDIEEWQKYAEKKVEFIRFPGTHFFMKNYYKEMADAVIERLVNR